MVLLLTGLVCASPAFAACPYLGTITAAGTYTLDVKNLFTVGGTVTWAAIRDAIACAKKGLGGGSGHNVTVIINLPAGNIDLSKNFNVGRGSIQIEDFNCTEPSAINCGNVGSEPSNSSNHLVVRGAGKGKTFIINAMDSSNHNNDQTGLWVSDSTNVTFTGMAFTWPYMMVTQGRVVSSNTKSVTIDIEKGFPSPDKLIDTVNFPNSGRYLHDFTYYRIANDPVIYCRLNPNPVSADGYAKSTQIPWIPGVKRPDPARFPRRWVIPFEKARKSAPYAPGMIIGIKSKEGDNVYTLKNVSYFTFDDVAWIRRSRGVFTGDSSTGVGSVNVTVKNSTILPEAPINAIQPCMSTPDGGPQVGGRLGLHSSGHLFTGNYFVGTGDDAIAFFDVTDSTVTNNTLIGAFSSRGLMLDFTDPNKSITSGRSGISFCTPANKFRYNAIYQKIGDPAPSLLITCP